MPEFVDRQPRWVKDAVVVGAVLAASVLELLLGGGFGDFADVTKDPDLLAFLLVGVCSGSLVWRHRYPYEVLVATTALSLLIAALSYGVHAPTAPAVALYTIAVGPRTRRPWPVLAFAAVSWLALVLIEEQATPYAIADYLLPGLIWSGAWLIGDRQRSVRLSVAAQVAQARGERELVIAEERARIARELHDSAGHAVNTILVHAGAARVLRDRDPERSAAAVATIETIARETVEEIDRIVGLLREDRDVDRLPLPGLEQVPALVERQREAGLDVALSMESHPEVGLPAPVSRAVYRIAQESLTNASRHGTGSATVDIEVGPDAVSLRVANPVPGGVGTRPRPRASGGRGLAGIRERAKLLGGEVQAGQRGAQFELSARLPYARTQR